MIMQNQLILQAPDGKKISLIAEVGRYFSADGHFDERNYSRTLQEYVDSFRTLYPNKTLFQEKVHSWISTYLNSVMAYLKEKDMVEASLKLFSISMEECINMGLSHVAFSMDHLQYIFSMLSSPAVAVNEDNRKLSRDEKKKKIFKAALQAFAEEGYYKATIDKIASLSGVGKGSVYRYFKSKEELLGQLLKEEYDKIVKRISYTFSKEDDVLLQIEEMIEFWVSYIEENHVVYRLIQSEDISTNFGEKTMFYDYIITHLPMIKERVLALYTKQDMKITSFYTAFYGIFGFIDGVFRKWMRSGRKYSLKEEIPLILEIVFNGFAGEGYTNKHYYIPPEEKKTS
jgi:AcrR family transcriptional regulator